MIAFGFTLWFTGRPAAGKSTLAAAVQQELRQLDQYSLLLDSDDVRPILGRASDFGPAGRDDFYQQLIMLAALASGQALPVLIAATAHRRVYHQAARRQLNRLALIHVDCPPEICRQRDPKGLYAAAAAGCITGLPGADIAYELPQAPDLTIDTSQTATATAAYRVLHLLIDRGWLRRAGTPTESHKEV